MPVVGFDSVSGIERAIAAVRKVEQWNGSPPDPAGRGGQPGSPLFAKVTGAISGGVYPAVFTRWDSATSAWVDEAGTCKAIAADGSVLTSGSRYLGRVGGTSGGSPLVIVATAVAASGPLLGKVTAGPSSGVYTVRRQKRNTSTNAIEDYSPTTDFTSVVSAETLAGGDYVEMFPLAGDPSAFFAAHKIGAPAAAALARLGVTGSSAGTDSVSGASVTGLTSAVTGWTPANGQVGVWWQQGATKYVAPMQFASSGQPGLVSAANQTLGAGTKTVDDLVAGSVTANTVAVNNYQAVGPGEGANGTCFTTLVGFDHTLSAANAIAAGSSSQPGVISVTRGTVTPGTGPTSGGIEISAHGSGFPTIKFFDGAGHTAQITMDASGHIVLT